MRDSVETMVSDDLERVAGRVVPDPTWTSTVLGHMARRRVVRRRWTMAASVVGVAAASLVVAWVGSSVPNRESPASTSDEGVVDVGGRHLQLSCVGASPAGGVTVLMDTDLGAGPGSFGDVPQQLSPDLRVCLYDRAGTGDSDAADSFPRTAMDLSDDIARLISTGRLGERVLLVSTGFSALSATVFATEHPDLVAGLVLLDPIGPEVAGRELAALGDRQPREPRLVTDLRAALSGDARSLNGEQVSWPASERQSEEILGEDGPAFGDLPVTVLWSGLGREALPPLPDPMRDAWWSAVREGQLGYAAESSAGQLREIPGVTGAPATAAPSQLIAVIRELTALSSGG